jgi:hypothetical protein
VGTQMIKTSGSANRVMSLVAENWPFPCRGWPNSDMSAAGMCFIGFTPVQKLHLMSIGIETQNGESHLTEAQDQR